MCDTMVALGPATATGAVLFGKNSDREFDEAQYLEFIPRRRHGAGARVRLTHVEIEQARETNALLLSRPYWIWGAEIGANEHGLVIGNEALHTLVDPSADAGIIGMDFVRLALERARDVDEAIAVITRLLSEHGQSGRCSVKRPLSYFNSFLLADARDAKVLETVDREWVVSPVGDYYSISNTMTVGAQFESYSANLRARAIEAGLHSASQPFAFNSVFENATRAASGRFRRARSMELLAAANGRLQAPDLFRVLRDHAEGPPVPGGTTKSRICFHDREFPLGQTTASWVSETRPGRAVYWVTATSAPCSSVFKPLMLGIEPPDHGPRPGAIEDDESLWWRHERMRLRLERAGSLQPAFEAERDALEETFIEAMARCPAISDDASRAEARRIIASCWSQALDFEERWGERILRTACA